MGIADELRIFQEGMRDLGEGFAAIGRARREAKGQELFEKFQMEKDTSEKSIREKALLAGLNTDAVDKDVAKQNVALSDKFLNNLRASGIDSRPFVEQFMYQQKMNEPGIAEQIRLRSEAEKDQIKYRASFDKRPTAENLEQTEMRKLMFEDKREELKRHREQQKLKAELPVGFSAIEGKTLNPKDVEDIKAGIALKNKIIPKVERLYSLVAKHGSELTGDVAKEMKQLRHEIMLDYKGPELANLGVIQKADMELMDNIIDDPTSLVSNMKGLFFGWGKQGIVDRIGGFKDRINNSIDAAAYSRNISLDHKKISATSVPGLKMRK